MSALTSVACPSCLGGIFAGMKFCPHCGAKTDRAMQDPAPLSCPDCRAQMQQVRVGATDLMECSSCASTWLDADTFTQLCIDRERRGAMAAMVGTTRPPADKPRLSGVRYLPCPVCGKTMNRQNFGRRSGVIIDVCKGHGVWFEAGELRAVMSFVDGGGLEESRRIESEKQREEQRQLMRELGKLVASRPDSPPRSSTSETIIRAALSTLFD